MQKQILISWNEVKKGNELVHLNLTSNPKTQKRREPHTQMDKLKTRTVNRTQTGGHSANLIENSSNIYFYLLSILNFKTE